jgi:hypothetical protein
MGVSVSPSLNISVTPNPVCLGNSIAWDLSGSYAPGSSIFPEITRMVRRGHLQLQQISLVRLAYLKLILRKLMSLIVAIRFYWTQYTPRPMVAAYIIGNKL